MFIFELLYKIGYDLYHKIKKSGKNIENEEIVYEKCEHIFLPIDSSKKILACSKCGFLIKKDDILPKVPENFFLKEKSDK